LGVLLSPGAWGQEFSLGEKMRDQNGRPLGIAANEGSTVSFTVNLSAAVSNETRVQYTITHVDIQGVPFPFDGTSADDFNTPLSGVIAVPANQTTATFQVRHAVDAGEEPEEFYLFTLSAPSGGTGSPTAPTVAACPAVDDAYIDANARDLTFQSSGCQLAQVNSSSAISGVGRSAVTLSGETSVAEGEVQTYTLTANPAPLAPSIRVALGLRSNTTASTEDYEVRDSQGNAIALSQGFGNRYYTINLPRASATVDFQIAFLRDTAADPGEILAFQLNGANSSSEVAGLSPAAFSITVADGSPSDNPQVSISGPASAVSEGGSAEFTIRVDRPISGNVTVAWAVSGAGVRPAQAEDLGAGGSTFPGGDVVIMAGDTPSQTFTIAIFDDSLAEPAPETFRVTISNPRGQNAEIIAPQYGDSTADVSIAPSEVPSVTREFSLSAGAASVTEGDAATYTVSISGPAPSQTLTITWNVTGDGGPFTSNPTSLTFAAADGANASKTFTVTSTENTLSDPTRFYTVALNDPTGGDAAHGDFAGANSVQRTMLQDDDELRAHFTSATTSGSESGSMSFAVQLSAVSGGSATGSSAEITLTFTAAGGSASLSDDVNFPDPARLTIASGALSALTGTFEVPLVDDMLNEGAELFTVTIATASGANVSVPATSTLALIHI